MQSDMLPYMSEWSQKIRQMWSTPGFLFSAGKCADTNGNICDAKKCESKLYDYCPIRASVTDEGVVTWQDAEESNIKMFINSDPEIYRRSKGEVVKNCCQLCRTDMRNKNPCNRAGIF